MWVKLTKNTPPLTYRWKVKVILRSRMYTCCLMVIHPYADIWYAYIRKQRHLARLKPMVKIFFLLRSKSNRVHEFTWQIVPWWYTQVPNKVWLCLRPKKSWGLNTKSCHKLINLTLRLKVNVVLGSWMYLTHSLTVIDPCAENGMPMWKLTEVTGRTWRHDKSPINLTLKSEVNIKSGTWMYLSYLLIVIDPCAKYGKPMSNKKSSWNGHKKMSKTL